MMRSVTRIAAVALLAFTLMQLTACAKPRSEAVGAGVATETPSAPEPTEAVPSPTPEATVEPTVCVTPDPFEMRFLDEAELAAVLARNEYTSDMQRTLVESAVSLIGKVTYFWGGKSYYVGFDPYWGKSMKVTSAGDPTTGMTLPYGLDCSGFICWCTAQLKKGTKWTANNVGEGSWHQWSHSEYVEEDDIRPGDIAFQNEYPGAETQHVGIVVGFLENGDPVIVHCSATENGVVVSTVGDVFHIFRRFKFMK